MLSAIIIAIECTLTGTVQMRSFMGLRICRKIPKKKYLLILKKKSKNAKKFQKLPNILENTKLPIIPKDPKIPKVPVLCTVKYCSGLTFAFISGVNLTINHVLHRL